MKKRLLAIVPLMFLGALFSCSKSETPAAPSENNGGENNNNGGDSGEQEIALGSDVIGNWGFRTKDGKNRTSKNDGIEVYVDNETKFHFTVTRYYDSFAPSVFTYEGQIKGITAGVASCAAVFSNGYLNHGSISETATTAAKAQFKTYNSSIADIYEGESDFQFTFHRLSNDSYNNGYITVENTAMDLTFGVFDAVDSAASGTTSETTAKKMAAKEITLGSSVLGNWNYQTAAGKDRTDDHQKVEVYVDSETKFHFTVTQYYEAFAPSLFTYEGQITGIASGVGSCFAVPLNNGYLSHGAISEAATTAASTQFKAYKDTIADIYEGESQFQIKFHRLAEDVYDNGYITVDNTGMDITFGVFGAVDSTK